MTGIDKGRRVDVSQQQANILVRIAWGLKRRAIAAELGIHPSTVTYHVAQMQRSFATTSQVTMVLVAVVGGILTNDQWPMQLTGDLCFWIDN